jgi:hypothetical protein
MNDRLALGRLWWKELRQLLPLLTLLPILGMLFLLFGWLAHGGHVAESLIVGAGLISLAMPGLFAAGVGALSVGYEKEQRTIGWLSSLPISPDRIIRVKLGAAFLGLLALWLVGGIFFSLSSRFNEDALTMEASWFSWPLHTLFVLLAGFALAWRSRSGLVAILLIVPVAALPLLLANAIDAVRHWRFDFHHDPEVLTLVFSQVLLGVLAWWLTIRWGHSSLSPESVTTSRFAFRWPWRETYRTPQRQAGYGAVTSPTAAMVWQFLNQSRGLLSGVTALLALALAWFALTERGQVEPAPWPIFLTILGISWLGVSVFQSDSVGQRIRFLADRGIAPGLVWFTRQMAPAALLAAFLLVILLVRYLTGVVAFDELLSAADGWPLMIAGVVMMYVVSQWVAQLLPSPIVSAIVAPTTTMLGFAYAAFSQLQLGTPIWLLLAVLFIPLVATRAMTRRWMDRRFGPSYWVTHAGFLVAMLLLPAVPILIIIAKQPGMPSDVARELAAAVDSSRYAAITVQPLELVLGKQEDPGLSLDMPSPDADAGFSMGGSAAEATKPTKNVPEPAASWLEQWSADLESIRQQLDASTGPISASSARVLEYLRGIATLTRMSLERSAEGAEASQAAGTALADPDSAARLHAESIRLLAEIGGRLRLSHRLIDQDSADLVDIWLLTEWQRPGVRERLGETLDRSTTQSLADRVGRQRARERAIAISWAEFNRARHPQFGYLTNQLGGYDLGSVSGSQAAQGAWLVNRRIGHAVSELWQWARVGAAGTTPERLRRVAEAWGQPPLKYGVGELGSHFRADDLDRFRHRGFSALSAVGSQWFADWERQAESLATKP